MPKTLFTNATFTLSPLLRCLEAEIDSTGKTTEQKNNLAAAHKHFTDGLERIEKAEPKKQ